MLMGSDLIRPPASARKDRSFPVVEDGLVIGQLWAFGQPIRKLGRLDRNEVAVMTRRGHLGRRLVGDGAGHPSLPRSSGTIGMPRSSAVRCLAQSAGQRYPPFLHRPSRGLPDGGVLRFLKRRSPRQLHGNRQLSLQVATKAISPRIVGAGILLVVERRLPSGQYR